MKRRRHGKPMNDSNGFSALTTKLSHLRRHRGSLGFSPLLDLLDSINDPYNRKYVRRRQLEIPPLPQLYEWTNNPNMALTLPRTLLENTVRDYWNNPDYNLEQDLVDGDLVIPPDPPKFLKGFTTDEDYPFRLTKTKVILGTYENLNKYLRGENV